MDVLGFHLASPYGSQWGHRGFTHSIVFALVFGSLMAALFYRKHPAFRNIALFLVLATVSHPLLDMLTNGGKGIALWWPFSLERIFFPWRPIQVSPLGAGAFFSRWGLRVLASELFWIGFPALFLVALSHFLRKMKEDHD
ncbi:MAG: metal-dependent hydrolase [Lewinellaceae bacterium]|nr:metal-dependent hydrolase [Lewinellaceae bacterium]